MEQEDKKILQQKIDSLYEILIWFLIVDWDIEESEVDEMMVWLLDSLNRDDKTVMPSQAFGHVIKKIAEDPENFAKNALFLYLAITREEQTNILIYISQVIFADDDFSDKEYELFVKLMQAWKLEKKDLIV